MAATATLRISNRTRGTDLAVRAWAARTFWTRLAGLLGRKSLDEGQGLLIEPCKSVHTAFLRFRIDIIYIDRSSRVVKLVPAMKTFRASAAMMTSHAVIELPAGIIERSQTSLGDEIEFVPCTDP